VRLQVAELGRSLSYYQGVLGLRVLRQDERMAILGPAGAPLPLIELQARPGSAPPRGLLGLYHFAMLLPDRAALGRFLQHLAALGVRPGSADHLVSEALYLRDPDGLGIEVYADRPRTTWEGHGAELAMDTLPLNAADVLRAGGAAPWTGMPAGTTMGHLHLHVGDLTEAERFFHAALGLDKMVWSYPGALFLSTGGYHHHLGLNTWAGPAAPPPGKGDARLLEWELVVPDGDQVEQAARSLEQAGYAVERTASGWRAADPWRTTLSCRSASQPR
jgi:catechol 2,3-dioxygenase